MKRLKTKCEHCEKDLTPDKWDQTDWSIYCSQECEQEADLVMSEYFNSKMKKFQP